MRSTAPLDREATLEDLYAVEGNAELVDGRLVLMSPTGGIHAAASLAIGSSLRTHQLAHGGGRAFADGVGFVVSPRRTFSPDAAWTTGPLDPAARLVEGAPAFAVEIRSPGDYGPAAERRMAAKRADYFAAGTQVVWDVDPLRERVIRAYRAGDPTTATIFHRGETADAEPAVPGWRFPVDQLFV